MYFVYWLVSQNKNKTYIGFTKDINERILKHKSKSVSTTKDFGKFSCLILEKVENLTQARKREKYWKANSGRKKLKEIFKDL